VLVFATCVACACVKTQLAAVTFWVHVELLRIVSYSINHENLTCIATSPMSTSYSVLTDIKYI